MTHSFPTSLPDPGLHPSKPPVLQATATGDAARWAAEHRNALHALVAEHGTLVVRGLGLRDGTETAAVFRQLGSLTTETETFAARQRRSAVVLHPRTGQRCWFNQIAFLNEWTLDPEVREYLVDLYGEDGLPFNTRFGNGDPIGADVVESINAVYEAHSAREPWQAGDL